MLRRRPIARTGCILILAVAAGCSSTGSAAPDGGYRRSFPVSRSELSPSGKGTFFDLTPGARSTFRDGDTTLTVTVLEETRVVDGVTTRIVEEREERGGKPLEISRNYFAIHRATGDVYYFGEDVDVYEGERLTHPGGWLSGVAGARFGLALPGNPAVGDRYYQELAPRVAMDRAEVVSTSETVETPAGTFKNCLHTRETTPIEADVGDKWYAPGVGLVKDDRSVLVVRSPKNP